LRRSLLKTAAPLKRGVSRTCRCLGFVPLVVVTFAPGCSTVRRPACTTASAPVENTISATVRDLDGTEYCKFRRYENLYDLDGDGVNDFIVLFYVEAPGGGGNNVLCFMAVFLSRKEWNPVVVQTGERGVRYTTAIEVEGHTIVLETMEYQAGDALCCPSGKGQLRYEVENGVLRPVATGEGG
jgi:hypothetical protein